MNYHIKFDERLKERFFNINKFILYLQKGFYSYKYIYDWEKFYETSLPENKDFYNYLNMEDNTNADYTHKRRVCKDFEKKIRRILWFYFQSDTFLFADIFGNYWYMCLEAYEFDPTRFFTASDLA